MGRLSDTIVNNILDVYFGSGSVAKPTNLYLGLSTSTPTNNNGAGIQEPSGGGYARVLIPNNSSYWTNATNRGKSNSQVITFPKATAVWGLVTYWVLYDSLTGGNLVLWGQLDVSQTVISGGTTEFPTNSITIDAPGT